MGLVLNMNSHHSTRSAPEGPGAASGNRRLQQTQAQVDEVWYLLLLSLQNIAE